MLEENSDNLDKIGKLLGYEDLGQMTDDLLEELERELTADYLTGSVEDDLTADDLEYWEQYLQKKGMN